MKFGRKAQPNPVVKIAIVLNKSISPTVGAKNLNSCPITPNKIVYQTKSVNFAATVSV